MSDLEETFALQLRAAKLPKPEREYQFAKPRRWRFDFAWPFDGGPFAGFAVEIEGGTWAKGRHTTGAGFAKDCEKYNEAALRGWIVLRFTGDDVKSGRALEMTKRALA